MGKHRKTVTRYSEQDFIKIVCGQCRMCRRNSKPSFCYLVYIDNPKKFMCTTFKHVVDLRRFLLVKGRDSIDLSDHDIETFLRDGFCGSSTCVESYDWKDCKLKVGCLAGLRKQINSGGSKVSQYRGIKEILQGVFKGDDNKRKSKRERKREKQRYVPVSYPFFFCSAALEGELSELLDGNYNQQPDKDKGGIPTSKGSSIEGSCSTEP